MVNPRNAKLLAGRIPGARLVIFPELGHLLFWEDPDGFADAVTSFLLADADVKEDPPAAVSRTARNAARDTSSGWRARLRAAMTARRRQAQRG